MFHTGTKLKMNYYFIIKVFLLCLLEKAFDLKLIKTGAAAYLSHALSLKVEHNIWNKAVLLYQRMKNVSILKDSISHLCNCSLHIFFQEKVHVNSLASLKQLCISSFLEKS